ncbi:MAG: PadR family transcriptional regulator [Sphingomicrobium sp.]
MVKSKSPLTDDEGTFLALVARIQPATAYQLSKVYEDSPVSNFGTSKGKIYPLIRRLKERGLLRSKPVQDDARGTEMLLCTASGERAVKQWVGEIRPNHLLLDDPLRTKVQSFDMLSPDERRSWIATARTALNEKLENLESYGQEVTVPFKDFVHDNAVASIRSRLEWLDRLEAGLFRRARA